MGDVRFFFTIRFCSRVFVLKNISQANQPYTRCLLQSISVAVRPLHPEELAEVAAFDFETSEGTPRTGAEKTKGKLYYQPAPVDHRRP